MPPDRQKGKISKENLFIILRIEISALNLKFPTFSSTPEFRFGITGNWSFLGVALQVQQQEVLFTSLLFAQQD